MLAEGKGVSVMRKANWHLLIEAPKGPLIGIQQCYDLADETRSLPLSAYSSTFLLDLTLLLIHPRYVKEFFYTWKSETKMRQARFPFVSSHLWWWNDMLWGLLRLKPAQRLITILPLRSTERTARPQFAPCHGNLARPSTFCAEPKDPHFYLCTGKSTGTTS